LTLKGNYIIIHVVSRLLSFKFLIIEARRFKLLLYNSSRSRAAW
jgi:hypothetical protein